MVLQTRILVTHHLNVLSAADIIVVMNKGTITEMGTYGQLVEQKGPLNEYLQNHLVEADKESSCVENGRLYSPLVVFDVIWP